MKNTISIDFLKKVIDYNPETGIALWKPRNDSLMGDTNLTQSWNDKFAGKPAGSLSSKGYIIVSFKHNIESGGKLCKILMHRIAWALVHNEWPESMLDHDNGIRHDNRIANLKLSDNSKNGKNSVPRSGSGYKNICWDKTRNKWLVTLKTNGKVTNIGRFENLEEAIIERNKSYKEHGYPIARDNPNLDYIKECVK